MSKNARRKYLRRLEREVRALTFRLLEVEATNQRLCRQLLDEKLKYQRLYKSKLTEIVVVPDRMCPPGTIYLIGEQRDR